RYQMPIIVLSDKKLASVYTTIDKLELKYDQIDRGEVFTGTEWTAVDAKGPNDSGSQAGHNGNGHGKLDLAQVKEYLRYAMILDALRALEAQGKKVNFLQCRLMKPFPADAVAAILRSAKRIVSVEENYIGQLAQLVQEQTGVMIADRINKFDGRPFSEDEMIR